MGDVVNFTFAAGGGWETVANPIIFMVESNWKLGCA